MKSAFKKYLKHIEKLEKEYGSLESFVLCTTNLKSQHKMKIEEYSSQDLSKVYKSLEGLELADLYDFQNGRFDGKFG